MKSCYGRRDFSRLHFRGDLLDDEQIPFEFPELVSNPEPRCPCVLLLDTSVSMSGKPLAELNDGVHVFREQILADSLATQRVEVAMVSFGPVRTLVHFQPFDQFDPPHLTPTGDTPMGEAIVTGLGMLAERKKNYRAAGVSYYRPWVFLITDGAPTDNWAEAARLVHDGDSDARKAFSFFAVGVQGADMSRLAQICSPNRPPLKLQGLNFRELFLWLSASMKAVSQSQIGTAVKLPPPGWMAA
jgi:uncharacterized protein YegL